MHITHKQNKSGPTNTTFYYLDTLIRILTEDIITKLQLGIAMNLIDVQVSQFSKLKMAILLRMIGILC